MANLLGSETSPYLRQHRDNPVDWHPWGPEALDRARREDKPILLSVGYSACHWCHVMAHESFESPEIAALMNEHFVNVKVDREERPDLDQIYQRVAQVMTRGGGWPLTVFLTPDLKPFYGGTYFPPEDKWGRPGFPRLLRALADAYRGDRATVDENARRLTEAILSLDSEGGSGAGAAGAAAGPHRDRDAAAAAEALLQAVDWTHGGVGSAPKFPNPMVHALFWRVGGEPRKAALLALRKMARGGIYDQLGGGFSRYSVDQRWAVPHFEKMLYDNALLLALYAEPLLEDAAGLARLEAADRELFVSTIRGTVDWALREMRSPEGGFYAAQDADSEGEEGKFFVWTPEEIAAVLGEGTPETRAAFVRYGVTPEGNFEHSGATVLSETEGWVESARKAGLAGGELELRAAGERARARLFEARSRRVAPGLDDKVLASWNGLMISGLLWAAEALGAAGLAEEGARARDAALGAFRFALERLETSPGRLAAAWHRDEHRDGGPGKPRFAGYLDDYAFLARAAVDVARFGGSRKTAEGALAAAARWARTVTERFADAKAPGYFFTADDHERLLTRPKSTGDQAIPSGTAVALEAMAALAELLPPEEGAPFARELEGQLSRLWAEARESPFGSAELLGLGLRLERGFITVSGVDRAPVAHSLVLAKPGGPAGQLCHRGVCELPGAGTGGDAAAGLRERVLAKLRA